MRVLVTGLRFSDGEHDLLAIAQPSDLPFHTLAEAAHPLHAAGLLKG